MEGNGSCNMGKKTNKISIVVEIKNKKMGAGQTISCVRGTDGERKQKSDN